MPKKTRKKKIAKTKVAKSKKTKKTTKKTASKKTSRTPKTMEELLKATPYKFKGLKRGETVEGIVTDITKRTVLMDIGAKTEGVVISKEYEETADLISSLKVGDKIKAVVYSPENDKGQILLSIKETALDHKWDLFEQHLETQETIEVRGLEVNKGGLIARLMGTRGFVPASQFSHQYLGNLDRLQNKLFKVKVIEVSRDKNRLIFSEKQVSEAVVLAQKKAALKKVKNGEIYIGVVSGVMPFGIFVRVKVDKELFLEGLVHISEISWEKVDNLNKIYKSGDKTKVKVLEVDKASGKLNLSIKQLTADPWADLVKKYPLEKKAKGKVIRLASFGAFVELELGVEGLIHISKIPADFDIKVDKQVDVYIESVEPEKRRMSLGLVLKEKPVGYK